MDTAFIGFTLDFIGKLLVAYTAIRIHHRLYKEMGVDRKVLDGMVLEQKLALLGLCLIVVGYALQVPSKLHG